MVRLLTLTLSIAGLSAFFTGCSHELSGEYCASLCSPWDDDCRDACRHDDYRVDEAPHLCGSGHSRDATCRPPSDRPAGLPGDRDGDGLSDSDEARCNTNPDVVDSDGDGISDALEDSDGDGYINAVEVAAGTDPGDVNSFPPSDTDGDTLTDDEEIALGTSPTSPDTDGDGFRDADEIARGTDPLSADTDGDGTDDGDEIECGVSPLDPWMDCDDAC